MAFTLRKDSKIGVIADSVFAVFASPAVPALTGLAPLIRARFSPTGIPAVGVRSIPTWYVDAASGRATANVSAIMATELALFPKNITHLMVQLGINDAAAINGATLTLGTFQTQVQTILAACVAQVGGANVIWLGPWAHDSGDFAAQIAQIDGVMPGLCAAVGAAYVQWSTVSNGGGNSIADGTHCTQAGANALGVLTNASIQAAA